MATGVFKQQLEDTQIELSITSCSQCPEVMAEPEALTAILVSLLANARDAVLDRWKQRAGGRIQIDIQPTQDSVSISVVDNGGGVPAASLSRIFEPFFTTKLKQQAPGLGLVVSRHRIEEMGGTIAAENRANGLAVTVTLPTQANQETGDLGVIPVK